MTGESYYGYTQWAVAPLGHPNLRCIAPGDTAADIYASWVFHNNAFCLSTMGGWAYVINGRQDQNEFRFDPWHLPLADPRSRRRQEQGLHRVDGDQARDAYWDRINVCHRYADVKIPVMHWGGWYDVFLNGTMDGWEGVREASPEVREDQWLVIGATDHELSPEFTCRIGRVPIANHGYAHDRVEEFMDHWLKGEDNDLARRGRVRYFTIGRDHWRSADEWPLPGTEFGRYYLHSRGHADAVVSDGALTTEAPLEEPADRYVYDPRDPVTYWLGVNL